MKAGFDSQGYTTSHYIFSRGLTASGRHCFTVRFDSTKGIKTTTFLIREIRNPYYEKN